MTTIDQLHCRWCGEPINAPKRGQRFCCSKHRYLWHQAQRIPPSKFDERVRAMVQAELKIVGVRPGDRGPTSREVV